MIRKFNESSYRGIFENKIEFAKKFDKFFNRDWIASTCSRDDFLVFSKNKEKLIYKPINNAQGEGIKVLHLENNAEKFYNDFSDKPEAILEDWIMQNDILSNIYPNAVNCLRIITLFDGKKVHRITGGITFAIKDEIANGSLESLIAPVDMETGIINKPAATFKSKLYKNHPTTGKQIEGIKLPFWNEVIKMLDEAGRIVPEVKYVGWDIAITVNGPCLIEGNTSPGYKYYQIPAHMTNHIGNKDKYVRFLK